MIKMCKSVTGEFVISSEKTSTKLENVVSPFVIPFIGQYPTLQETPPVANIYLCQPKYSGCPKKTRLEHIAPCGAIYRTCMVHRWKEQFNRHRTRQNEVCMIIRCLLMALFAKVVWPTTPKKKWKKKNEKLFIVDVSAGSHQTIFPCGKIAPFVTTNNIKSDGSDYAIFLCDFYVIKI